MKENLFNNQVDTKTEKPVKKKKNKKTLPIIIATTILGWIVPTLFKITGLSFVDKMLWKVLFSLALNVATWIVSFFCMTGIIKTKKDKETTKVATYLVVVIVFCASLATVLSFIEKISPIFVTIVVSILIVAIIILTTKFDNRLAKKKTKHAFISDDKKGKTLVKSSQNEVNVLKLETLFELWESEGKKQEVLFAANSERPDILWVKLTKTPFKSGKLYALVKYINQSEPITEEVFFAEKQVWYKFEEVVENRKENKTSA